MKIKLKGNIETVCYKSIDEIDKVIWNQFVSNDDFYKKYEFIQLIASTQTQIQHRFVQLYQNNSTIGFLYFQQIALDGKDIFEFINNNTSSIKRFLQKRYEKNAINILNLGNVFFTGDNGIISAQETIIYPLLNKIFKCVCKTFDCKIHSFVIGDTPSVLTENSCGFSFKQFYTEPDMQLTLQANWLCFDDYLQALTSKYRVRTKKVLKGSSQIISKDFTYEAIVAYQNEIQALYDNVMQQTNFKLTTLNTAMYSELSKLYENKLVFKAYFLEDKLVGFAVIFLCLSNTMHIHYIGLNYEVNNDYKLYNRMLLDFVHLAIDKRYSKIHFGRTATEIKSTIGAEPIPLNAFVKLNSWFNIVLKYAYQPNMESNYTIRHPFKNEM
ncbi:MAG: hypothetical protein H6553_07365 [Chitinophagales bacterium]|nr:hypothetical protein [Chitinophagales bacterium]